MPALIEQGHRVFLVATRDSKIIVHACKQNIPCLYLSMRNAVHFPSIARLLFWIYYYSVDIFHAHSPKDAWVAGISRWMSFRKVKLVRARHVSNPVRRAYSYSRFPDSLHVISEASREILVSKYAV